MCIIHIFAASLDITQGDGGSPMVCPITDIDGQYYLAGLVGWGIGCGMEIPGMCTYLKDTHKHI